jgi:type IV pilus assembly protein PilY1
MLFAHRRLISLTAGTLLALACGAPALADDTEIYVSNGLVNDVRPNILFIMDTSGSMDEKDVSLAKAPYDAGTAYGGSCDTSHVYFSRGTADIPTCATANWVNKTAVKCAAGRAGMAGIAGFWTGRTGQWNPDFTAWKDLRANAPDDVVECYADANIDGIDAASAEKYARNGDAAHKWTSDSAKQLDWGAIATHTLYSANYLNWKAKTGPATTAKRIAVVQRALTELASSVDDVNMGLMRFSDNCNQASRGNPGCDAEHTAEGGMILKKIDNIRTSRDALITTANLQAPGGNTPLSETMYEAGQYWAGKAVDYGDDSMGRQFASLTADRDKIPDRTSQPSARETRGSDQSRYESPIKYQCQKNFNILLTDGLPTQDTSANAKMKALTDARGRTFKAETGNPTAACTNEDKGAGACLDDMTAYLANADLVNLSPPGVDDMQEEHVLTYTIGFGNDIKDDGSGFLTEAANRGGTDPSYNATDLEGLVDTLRNIVTKISDSRGTFVTPSVSVNSFNRNQTLNDLYVSLFTPTQSEHWPGNLKKYRLKNGVIVDAANAVAVGTDGFFQEGTRSVWSATADEQYVEKGGAANLIPQPRTVYTHFSGMDLNTADNLLTTANPNLTDALLGTGSPTPTKLQLINWIHDLDPTKTTAVSRHVMGDPLHSHPAVVTYGGTAAAPNAYDTVVFVATNDGYLHAITGSTGQDSATKDSVGGGTELWSFIPQELLGRLVNVYRDDPIANRTYGLDGDIRVLKYDVNQNGIIESGDKVILYFGMRRGGRFYYALDVTDRTHPKLLWKDGPSLLPGVGETWSPPVITRVKVKDPATPQNDQFLVLLFGGGYDDGEENYSYVKDDSGHRIYMVDALSGALLWYAGGPGGDGTPNLLLDASNNKTNGTMNNAIPSELTVIDTNGDRFADRIYASDLGGRIWRFDITNGMTATDLVAGGVIAQLGAGDAPAGTTPAIADTRRFYSAPDIALVERRGADPYYNIAIGSGYRGHPKQSSTTAGIGATSDRFYSIRDKSPFMTMKQTDYKNFTPIQDGDLVDITGTIASTVVPLDKPGWKLDLRLNGTGAGEKVLGASTTANNVILFPTYTPADATTANPCKPMGVNRVYALSVDNGRPALNFYDSDDTIDAKDAFTQLNQDGIVDSVNVAVIRAADTSTPPGGTPPKDPDTNCIAGVEVLKKCVQVGGTVRTYWKRKS